MVVAAVEIIPLPKLAHLKHVKSRVLYIALKPKFGSKDGRLTTIAIPQALAGYF